MSFRDQCDCPPQRDYSLAVAIVGAIGGVLAATLPEVLRDRRARREAERNAGEKES